MIKNTIYLTKEMDKQVRAMAKESETTNISVVRKAVSVLTSIRNEMREGKSTRRLSITENGKIIKDILVANI